MASFFEKMDEWFQSTIMYNIDPRSEDWWLSFSPLVPASIVAIYLLLVLKLGPKFMAKREAFKIEPLIIVYNAVQVLACFYVFWGGCRVWIDHRYNFACQPVDPAVNEETIQSAHLVHTYYVIKISDLLDTIFFVLRKKFNQASFLHLYHHSIMILCGYLGTRFSLNGHFSMLGVVNSFVHVVMYSYYLYTALFPKRKMKLWIKKSLTTLQIAQFCFLGVHFGLPLLQPSCRVQKFWCVMLFIQAIVMIKLFSDFYRNAYLEPKKKVS